MRAEPNHSGNIESPLAPLSPEHRRTLIAGYLEQLQIVHGPAFLESAEELARENLPHDFIRMVRAVPAVLEEGRSNRKILATMPSLLGSLQDLLTIFKDDFPASRLPIRKLDGHINLLVEDLGSLLQSLHLKSLNANYGLFSRGQDNWALTDGEKVLLISRGERTDDSKERFRLRAWCADRFNELGLEQPTFERIGRFPFSHALTQYAPGETFYKLLQRRVGNEEHPVFIEALIGLGQFFRCLSSLKLPGYGPLVSDGSGYRGQFESPETAIEHLCSPFSGAGLDREYQKILGATGFSAKQIRIIQRAAEAILEDPSPPALSHGDPQLSNFLYDPVAKKVTVLDWDTPKLLRPGHFLGQLYDEWIRKAPKTAISREASFGSAVLGYTSSEPEQLALAQLAKRYALIESINKAVHYLDREDVSKRNPEGAVHLLAWSNYLVRRVEDV